MYIILMYNIYLLCNVLFCLLILLTERILSYICLFAASSLSKVCMDYNLFVFLLTASYSYYDGISAVRQDSGFCYQRLTAHTHRAALCDNANLSWLYTIYSYILYKSLLVLNIGTIHKYTVNFDLHYNTNFLLLIGDL